MSGLIFEPQAQFGSLDPDGEPWPFGYISKGPGRPVFMLEPVFEPKPGDVAGFTTLARQMAAAPDMLAALRAMDDFWTAEHLEGPDGDVTIWGGAGRLSEGTLTVWRQIRAALSKAAGTP